MDLLLFLLKLLFMLGLVFAMLAPLMAEYLSYKRDRERKITHKRFRLFLFSIVYFIAITIAMTFHTGIMSWIRSWPVVAWIANQLSIPSRFTYAVAVIAAILANALIGILFKLLLNFVRIGLKKKKLVKTADQDEKKDKDEGYTLRQKIERNVLKFFNQERWFFAAKILKYLNISLTLLYAAAFILYQLPVFWGAGWIPYSFILRLFRSGYIYPMITLLPLWEAYFFLAGVELLEEECPEFYSDETRALTQSAPALETVNEECKKLFKDYFAYQIGGITLDEELASSEHHEETKWIAKGVEDNERNPREIKECYLKCLDIIVENDIGAIGEDGKRTTSGVLVNGGFFTEFSMYFLRYISAILSRGDNVIFVCNHQMQVEQTYAYVKEALEQIYSLYHDGSGKRNIAFDHPVWKIRKVTQTCDDIACGDINDCSVLVTDLKFLTSQRFEARCREFIHLTDTVVFVDTLTSVNCYSRQMSIFDTSMKNIRNTNGIRAKNCSEKSNWKPTEGKNDAFEVRYMSNQIKYICFDDSRIPGLDKVLKNLLFVEFVSADGMRYNPKAIICCYNLEGRPNENGERIRIQSAKTEEDLSVLANMADYAVGFGAGVASLQVEKKIPYQDIAESICANANNGLRVQEGVNLFINSPNYDPDQYQVIVAFDHDDNLPMAVRSLLARSSDQPVLIMLFSRPYLFRDYYLDHIEQLWKPDQMMRIPVEQNGKHSAIRKILVKANSGGISVAEIYRILTDARLPEYKDAIQDRDLSGILRQILLDCGRHPHETLAWRDYFEYINFSDFNNDGVFVTEERICLRQRRLLFELLSNANSAKIVIDGEEMLLPLPKDRITQNYIVGQNMLYNGGIYVINNIDVGAGKLYVKHATGGRNNVPYQYIQDREYHIDFSDPEPERAYPTKHVQLNAAGEITLHEVKISVTRRPMEAIVKGYTAIDPRTMAMNGAQTHDFVSQAYVNMMGKEHVHEFKQTYRRYGKVKDPVCSSDMIMCDQTHINASPSGALVMSVKLTGEFGPEPQRISALAAVMLGEVLRAMFPSVSDAIAVCPVISESFYQKDSGEVWKKQYKAFCRGYAAENKDIELLIIEDCASDIGVISVLMSSGDHVLKMLFSPIYQYLQWYSKKSVKSNYLYFGEEKEPLCFDFDGLTKLSALLGKDDYKLRFVNVDTITQYDICDFCGKRYVKGGSVAELDDGRKMCTSCAENLVGNNKKTLKEHLERAKIFLESIYGITLDEYYEFCFESTVRISKAVKKKHDLVMRRGADIPLKAYVDDKKKVYAEYSLPSVNLSELLVRELTHVWQRKHLPHVAEDLAEGHIALVAIQYLRFLNQHSLALVRTNYYESTGNISGEGYRALVRALLKNPQFSNNPFRYLLETSGAVIEETIIPPSPRKIETGSHGLPYTPETPDRALDGRLTYFYYSHLTAPQQAAYDALLAAIEKHEETADGAGCSFDDLAKVSDAIAYDHPELFWYKTCSIKGNTIMPHYCASAEEAAALNGRIEEAAAKYLEGINDSMSAYDVALHLHVKMIGAVDYDTIALDKQKREGGPKKDKIDYLRTICGVFLEGKAVCEGYARGMQYLLQKCGVECAEVAGHIHKETGEESGAHAWNILKADGDYYYLDTTWDDSSNTVQTVKTNDPGFDYFCITTEELYRTRRVDLCPTDVPLCGATRCNYYYHNDLVLDTYDLDKIKIMAKKAAKNKCQSFTFKCKTRTLFEQALNQLCSVGRDCFEVLKAAAKEDKKILTSTYSYSYDKNIWTVTVKFKYK